MTVGRIPNIEGGIQPTLLTTTGDIIYASSASNPARLGIGSSAQVLTVAAGVPSWATPSSGGMTLLSTTSLSGTSTTISSISGAYTNLQIIINNPFTNTGGTLRINPNATDGISYNAFLSASTAGASSSISSYTGANLPTTSTPETTFFMNILNYAQTSNGKNFIFNGGFTSQTNVRMGAGFIGTTSAITSLQITTASGTPTFSGGTVLIYGVK